MRPILTDVRSESLRLKNSSNHEMTLHLEPWGEEVFFPTSVSLEVTLRGPTGDAMEVILGEDRVTLYGWSGSVISVFQNGKRIAGSDIPVPPTPKVL